MTITDLIRQLNKIKKQEPDTQVKILLDPNTDELIQDVKISPLNYTTQKLLDENFKNVDIDSETEWSSKNKTEDFNIPFIVITNNE